MTKEHTPTPWDADGLYIETSFATIASCGTSTLSKEEDKANAAHIVKCVNLHDELVACCNKIINNWGNLHHKDLMQLRAAVQKAGAL